MFNLIILYHICIEQQPGKIIKSNINLIYQRLNNVNIPFIEVSEIIFVTRFDFKENILDDSIQLQTIIEALE